jgi:hypothetical protein
MVKYLCKNCNVEVSKDAFKCPACEVIEDLLTPLGVSTPSIFNYTPKYTLKNLGFGGVVFYEAGQIMSQNPLIFKGFWTIWDDIKEENGASEEIRTLDLNVGNVSLYP